MSNVTIPWWGKIAAKIVLSQLPWGNQLGRKLGVFRHGAMDHPQYALDGFRTYFEMAGRPKEGKRFTALELGPGDSLASAMAIRAFGGGRCWLVDVGDFASKDLRLYGRTAELIREQGLLSIDPDALVSVDAILAACEASYLTQGLASLRPIPDGAVDFAWSRAVLEHVRRRDFAETIAELRRVLASDGVSVHRIDLRDHLANALNNLRFGDAIWESELMARSGFYTNRIRCSAMLEHFRAAGFEATVLEIERWERLPTPKSHMAERFRSLPDDELRISGFTVALRPI